MEMLKTKKFLGAEGADVQVRFKPEPDRTKRKFQVQVQPIAVFELNLTFGVWAQIIFSEHIRTPNLKRLSQADFFQIFASCLVLSVSLSLILCILTF
jgi:hypothetical protein